MSAATKIQHHRSDAELGAMGAALRSMVPAMSTAALDLLNRHLDMPCNGVCKAVLLPLSARLARYEISAADAADTFTAALGGGAE